MSANTEQRRQSIADWRIADPGSGGAISNSRTGTCNLTTGGAETRSLARPVNLGLELILNGAAVTTSCTITVEGGYNDEAETSLVISENGAPVVLKAVADSATTLAWRSATGNANTFSLGQSLGLLGTGRVGVPITSVLKQDGTVMAKQNSTTTGFLQLADKNIIIHIPANSTAESFAATVTAPSDLDISQDHLVTLNVVVSKSADADELTLDAELYGLIVTEDPETVWSSDGYDGSAVAIPADETTLQFAMAGDTLQSSGVDVLSLAFVLTLGGTNDGDVVHIHDIFWTYQKKLLTS